MSLVGSMLLVGKLTLCQLGIFEKSSLTQPGCLVLQLPYRGQAPRAPWRPQLLFMMAIMAKLLQN